MLSTTGSSGINAFTPATGYYPNPNHGPTVNTTTHSNYDSSSFSAVTDSHNRFQMDVVSRLSREVRTATTTGRIQELRMAVASGEYHPDAAEIAKRMLFHVEKE